MARIAMGGGGAARCNISVVGIIYHAGIPASDTRRTVSLFEVDEPFCDDLLWELAYSLIASAVSSTRRLVRLNQRPHHRDALQCTHRVSHNLHHALNRLFQCITHRINRQL